MEIIFLDSDFEEIKVVDAFNSFIWTDRFWSCGDFDLVLAPTEENVSVLNETSYFKFNSSPKNMILETFNIDSDIENGPLLIVKGRSLESILDRRIAWYPTTLTGNFQTEIEILLNDNVISPTITDRIISNFVMETSTDPAITALTIDVQVEGEYIYDIISSLCESKGIGFRVYYDRDSAQFKFKLIAGVDRSYNQTTNPFVTFSSKLDNLLNASYVESNKLLKTVVLVAGEEGIGNVKTTTVVEGNITGPNTELNRREIYYEANVNRNTPGQELSEAEYVSALEGKGEEKLAKHIFVQAFDGEVDTNMYNYGDEFSMGDILQIVDDYGHSTASRVIEMIYSEDESGINIYPTFQTIDS